MLYETLRARLGASLVLLPDKPEESLDSTLRALWFAASGSPRSAESALVDALPELSATQEALLEHLVLRRISGVPLAYITGRQRFMGIEMLVGPEVLVPRKETELLGKTAVRLAEEVARQSGTLTVIDTCTGSGNVALAVARFVPTARVYGADLSEDAVGVARRNARHLGFESDVEFRCGNLLEPFAGPDFFGKVDLLTCNPPYINSAKVSRMPSEIAEHEPRLAFDGGALGISVLMRLLRDAPQFLRANGWLAFEVGHGQGPALLQRMKSMAAFKELETVADVGETIRVICGRC